MYYNADFIAIVVASIANMVLGGIWYSPKLFLKPYMKLQGKDLPTGKPTKEQKKGMINSYIVMFIAGLAQAAVLYFLILITQAGTLGQYMTIAFLTWAGFQLAGIATDAMWTDKSPKLIVIDGFYSLFANILTVWVLTLFM